MAVTRGNVLSSPHAEAFLEGAVALSQRSTGVAPERLNQSGIVQRAPAARLFGTQQELARPLSWWDLFSWWHVAAMSWPGVGNRAHRGPVFLPWHRLYLRRLEQAIQIVGGDEDFALPYWDWAADGALPPAQQLQADVWSLLGPPNATVAQGTIGQLRVRLFNDSRDGRIYVGPPRRIWRAANDRSGLPTPQEESATLDDGAYDESPWNEESRRFRNKLEGFRDPRGRPSSPPPWMHNRVHVWAGGEMVSGTSPNDPLFWLNHCNVDRIWEGWMAGNGRSYLPSQEEGPPGQGAADPLFSIVWPTMTPSQLLDPGESGLDWYEYDDLPG